MNKLKKMNQRIQKQKTHRYWVIQTCLPRLGLGHVPILLEYGYHISKPKSFCFELAWCSVESFTSLIQSLWDKLSPLECRGFILSKK